MDETSDGELLRQMAAGSQSGMRTLVEKHSRTLIRYAWALVESPSDVDDVVQDTFVTAWRGADRIALSGESALPWLLVTCRNHAANLARSRSRKRTYPITDEPVWDDQQDARDRLRWVLDEIERLLWSFIFILQAVFLIIELHDNGEAAWFRWALPVLNLVIVAAYLASVV
ncbi:RNA polymerase sigma factor [Cnuibacter physcomitrellae]|uniref:RNA polymerase sigma factor n=1 Tax=Cnuibacter physcomitrellae TaxID=1619308 RepID=UPI002175A17F|nr:RNA polymerase sigma factor [Cnuibacter physcomitrellae]MCS5496349.1 RNA polymerase sigma factor [Cnuibacter physcomitrellae]